MLVVSRTARQTILVNGNITITVWRNGGTIKVGIDAPKSVPILRGELVKKEMKDAA